jgi:hypothetical protein
MWAGNVIGPAVGALGRILPCSRRSGLAVAAALLAASGLAVAATIALTAQPGSRPAAAEAHGLGRSAPVRIVIPKLGVDAEVRTLALDQGRLAVPPRAALAGWYRRGTSPGEPGSAVIMGHARAYRGGPAIFARLDRLLPGDRIAVLRADGRTARFAVEWLAAYSAVDRGHSRHGAVALRLVPVPVPVPGAAAAPAGPSQPVVFATLAP